MIWTDYDLDGYPDLYVANDRTRNFLFRNRGDGTFEDDLLAGVGYNGDGQDEASMGVDAGDVNGDGWLDLFTVHVDGETNTLYVNGGDRTFTDGTLLAGLGGPSLPFVGFGTNLFDHDNDGDEDIFVANGHFLDTTALYGRGAPHAQRDFLFRNDGKGIFEDVSDRSGDSFSRGQVGRGSAIGDIDNDGDIDIVVSNNNQPAVVLRNDGGNRKHFVLFRTIGTRSNRDGIGALVRIEAGGRSQLQEVRSGGSYLSHSDLRLHFGIGDAARVDRVEVRWPSGSVETFTDLPADHLFVLREGEGIVTRVHLR